MAARITNTSGSGIPLPYPFTGMIAAGATIVVDKTPAEVIAMIGVSQDLKVGFERDQASYDTSHGPVERPPFISPHFVQSYGANLDGTLWGWIGDVAVDGAVFSPTELPSQCLLNSLSICVNPDNAAADTSTHAALQVQRFNSFGAIEFLQEDGTTWDNAVEFKFVDPTAPIASYRLPHLLTWDGLAAAIDLSQFGYAFALWGETGAGAVIVSTTAPFIWSASPTV